MGMAVSFFLALGTTMVIYAALGQGGGVSGVVFLGVMVVGVTMRVLRPGS